jgi:hypothetical protein
MNNGLEHALFVDNPVFVNATKDSIQKTFVSACMRAANGGLDCNMPLFPRSSWRVDGGRKD